MRFTFAYPWMLYLLWTVPAWTLLLYHLRGQRHRKLTSFTGTTLAAKLLPPAKTHLEWIQIISISSTLILLLIAAAGPRSTQRREQEVTMRGRDVVMLIDVSRSMLANDVHPSRLVRAKADMLDVLDELGAGDRVAIVAFRHRATRITPFTTDQRFLRQAIASLSHYSAPPGETDIAAGIRMALQVFDDDSPAHKTVILISDGEDLARDAIRAAQQAGQRRIPFFTVGIGSRTGSTIPDPDNPQGIFMHNGQPIITRLEDEALISVARLTGGAYIPVETAGLGAVTLGQRIRDHLRAVEVQAYTTIEASEHAELFAYFLLPAILLLLLAGACSQGQLRMHKAIRMLILLATATSTLAQTNDFTVPQQSHRAIARQAQGRHRAGEAEAAANLYIEAASQAGIPHNIRDRYRYNAAIAALQAGNHQMASDLLADLPPLHQAHLARALTQFKRGALAPDGTAEGYRNRLERWQDAARLLQEHWQQSGTAEAGEDLQALDSMLPAAARDASVAEVLERYADSSPEALAWEMLQQQRAQDQAQTHADLPPVGPDRLRLFEEQARKRNELAEQYLALSHNLQAAGIPPEQLAPLVREYEQQAKQSETLRDITRPDPGPAAEVGHPLYNTWRTIGSPESLLTESVRQQEWLDAIARGSATQRLPVPPAHLQAEAGALTELFADRFQPPPDTDADTIEQINALTANTARLQRLAAEMLALNDQDGARTVQAEALEALRQLAELLPEPPPSESEQQQQEEEQQQQPQETEPDSGETEDETEMLPVPQPEDPEDQTETPVEPEEQDPEDDTFDLDGLLEQVEQRAQEYRDRIQEREERRQRQRGARDW
ncbi:MAG: vWA domain-containing protein [Kiritimatiellia bacterium]